MAILWLTSTLLALLCWVPLGGNAQLKTGFYSSTCPRAETIVRSTVETHFRMDPTVAPALLRLHFHDCFVQGCDGSILITGSSSERAAGPNLSLRGFEVIDDAKAKLESFCPGVVSCADIVALAARDAVDLNVNIEFFCREINVKSDGPSWAVPLGRRDGRVSSASDSLSLPSPLDSVATQRQKFASKGLDDHDLVTLVGGHTIGKTDCRFFQYRLYNFTTTGRSDPSFNQAALTELQSLCPRGGAGLNRVALDRGSEGKFDSSFFKNVRDGNAVLESDQRLWEDPSTRKAVEGYAGRFRGLFGFRFEFEFTKAMVKMSGVGVKTGTEGEIRKSCARFN